jgi:hypothetical protein
MNRRDEVPTEDQLLCRYCGCIVSGLPTSGRYQESGELIADCLPRHSDLMRRESTAAATV